MVHLDAVRCPCGRCLVLTAGDPEQWTRGYSARVEAVALAALRGGWIYYQPTGAWSCAACVARSDHSGAEYRAAARRMVETIRRAVGL